MFTRLIEAIGLRRVIPDSPTGFLPRLPFQDQADCLASIFEPDDELQSIAGIGCIILYVDADNNESERRITCRRLITSNGGRYVHALCHERRASRTFRIDRIREVTCGTTGEISNSSDFFGHFEAEESDESERSFGLQFKLCADLRAGMNILVFLAKADGKIVPEELAVVNDFCRSFALRFADDRFAFAGACRYTARLAPDAETLFVALERLKREEAPPGLASLIRNFAGTIIDADGLQHRNEFYYGCQIQEHLAA